MRLELVLERCSQDGRPLVEFTTVKYSVEAKSNGAFYERKWLFTIIIIDYSIWTQAIAFLLLPQSTLTHAYSTLCALVLLIALLLSLVFASLPSAPDVSMANGCDMSPLWWPLYTSSFWDV